MRWFRTTASLEETKQFAATLAPYLQEGDVVVLKGDLGAGKTHFVQGLAQGLGIQNVVTSPTFTIMLSYEEGARLPLYHFDWYRLEHSSELEEVGYYEVIDGPGIVCIEWGDSFPHELPDDVIEIAITHKEEGQRAFEVVARGKRAQQCILSWYTNPQAQLEKEETNE